MTTTVAPVATSRHDLRLALGALGVVFGDIGTSPLYAFRESFIGLHPLPIEPLYVMGVLSLIFWALVLVVTVKYVLITMHADNRGEGGSFALLALIRRVTPSARALPAISMAALAATALFYGDAVITPAISILSAVEGLSLVDPAFSAAVVPLTLAIVLALFAIQHFGTAVVGRWFGPVMLLWFAVLGLLGVLNIAARPGVLLAANPYHAVAFVGADPLRAFLTLGTVVLTITGAEALYADMGHFGRRPIARAWMANSLWYWVTSVTRPVSCGRGLTSENQTSSPFTNSSTPNRPWPPSAWVTLAAMSRLACKAAALIAWGCQLST